MKGNPKNKSRATQRRRSEQDRQRNAGKNGQNTLQSGKVIGKTGGFKYKDNELK